MYRVLCFFLLTLPACASLWSQGCVAIRHIGSCNGNSLQSNQLMPNEMLAGINYRYFKSFRHFRGTHEEPDRVSNNTEVINYAHNWDLNLMLGLRHRMFASATIPFVINERSSLYEHGRTERNMSYSRGIGDLRGSLGFWVFDAEKHSKGNLALSAGIKLPTGNYHATDIFYNVGPGGTPQVRPVDQSIQPGDGGLGFTLDAQLYRQLWKSLYVYASGFYLANPRETNGVRSFRETLSPLLANEAIMSVPDQFGLRAGLNLTPATGPWSLSLGARYEGIPVEDLIGGSAGFRRPGQVLSIEPALGYMQNGWLLNLSVPVALYRNRPQSVTDLETEQQSGTPRHGDAAFADYLINFSITRRIAGRH